MGMETTACYGPESIAATVVATFFTSIFCLGLGIFLYKRWRRQKGNHLVLVTDPEIVEDTYAFDNPCFKDGTPRTARNPDRPLSTVSVDTSVKDTTAKWSSPWSSLGIGSVSKLEKRKTLDDSYVGPNTTRVNTVSLRSRDFTGLGFNVCGNMREGIFVKDLLHRGPASESGRIHPGDRITSVKISFRSMVYEDALTILSYASPYDVELTVESGGTISRPTTLLKKTVGPGSNSPARICHPLYRSQSIPELSRHIKSSGKRLFVADPNESLCSTINSTLKSSKSTPGGHTLERHYDEAKINSHPYKFGIKVLPALDGTVHRIENQNEHNTNLERRSSRKNDKEVSVIASTPIMSEKPISEYYQKNRSNNLDSRCSSPEYTSENVPEEVHMAAMAARRNRKNSAELLKTLKGMSADNLESDDGKSLPKNKRKAPAPPGLSIVDGIVNDDTINDDKIESLTDYTESLSDYTESRRQRIAERSVDRRNSESDTDNEMQNSFTTIELDSADITIHHTPIPPPHVDNFNHVANDNEEEEDDDDIYRKAASLGDLSKYENKNLATLERAQSLDMADAGSRKRKAPLPPPEDIAEFSEDLTKLDDIDLFDRRKLKKSSEWGTLKDAIWSRDEVESEPRARKKSNGTLERSKSAVEIKSKFENIELYNLPLSKQLTQDFINAERIFNPDEDNSLARIMNNGEIIKAIELDDVELDFTEAKPSIDRVNGNDESVKKIKINNTTASRLDCDNHASDDSGGESISPKRMTFITEIKVSPSREIREPEITVTLNGKSASGKKPPVPPRRNDAASRALRDSDKQVVYVSEGFGEKKQSVTNIVVSSPALDDQEIHKK